jgi:hypothetical protein
MKEKDKPDWWGQPSPIGTGYNSTFH